MGAEALELFPIGKYWVVEKLLLKLTRMTLCVHEVEEGRISIDLVTRAHYGDIGAPAMLEGEFVWEMGLADPGAVVSDSFGLKSTELECHVGLVFDDLIASSCRSSHVLEVFAHETVAAARVRRVHHLHLLTAIASSIACLITEEQLFLALIAIDIFGSH